MHNDSKEGSEPIVSALYAKMLFSGTLIKKIAQMT